MRLKRIVSIFLFLLFINFSFSAYSATNNVIGNAATSAVVEQSAYSAEMEEAAIRAAAVRAVVRGAKAVGYGLAYAAGFVYGIFEGAYGKGGDDQELANVYSVSVINMKPATDLSDFNS
ncbi:MAG: hypothetical protein ACK4TA_19340 [Saprospiraceae bacterium]